MNFLRETDSTNTLALACGEDQAVFVADAQSAGRGRRAAPWHSAPGLGLWLSVALHRPPQDLGPAAVLAVREVIESWRAVARLGMEPPITVKWPNDLLVGGRKACGILVEHRAGWSALGLGLNVAHTAADFPEDLHGIATSLALAYGSAPPRDQLLGALLAALRPRLDRIAAGDGDAVFEEWRAALALEGRAITRGDVAGVVEALERDGALRVRMAGGGVRRVDSGVIEVVPSE